MALRTHRVCNKCNCIVILNCVKFERRQNMIYYCPDCKRGRFHYQTSHMRDRLIPVEVANYYIYDLPSVRGWVIDELLRAGWITQEQARGVANA
jgi:hypothetical protein